MTDQMQSEDVRDTVDLSIDAMGRANCSRLYRIRSTIQLDPIYQRQGNIWSVGNKQLFIDSLLNGFDIPKIYFHDGDPVEKGKKYAIIDGKQRLEALFDFYEDKFPLSDRFDLFNDSEVSSLGLSSDELASLAGMHYSEIDRELPQVARVLDACPLSVMVVTTNDIEAIEEMFSRLNEAVPLNAAEKRQALGDPMRTLVFKLSESPIFADVLPFTNRRYRHFDIAAKFLRWSLSMLEVDKWEDITAAKLDVKRSQLDRMFEVAKLDPGNTRWGSAYSLALTVANAIASRFHKSDPILSSVGTLSVVFLDELRSQRYEEFAKPLSREVLVAFESFRKNRDNLDPIESDIIGALTVAEYNRLTQSPNDGSALRLRLDVLEVYALALGTGAAPLSALSEAELID